MYTTYSSIGIIVTIVCTAVSTQKARGKKKLQPKDPRGGQRAKGCLTMSYKERRDSIEGRGQATNGMKNASTVDSKHQ